MIVKHFRKEHAKIRDYLVKLEEEAAEKAFHSSKKRLEFLKRRKHKLDSLLKDLQKQIDAVEKFIIGKTRQKKESQYNAERVTLLNDNVRELKAEFARATRLKKDLLKQQKKELKTLSGLLTGSREALKRAGKFESLKSLNKKNRAELFSEEKYVEEELELLLFFEGQLDAAEEGYKNKLVALARELRLLELRKKNLIERKFVQSEKGRDLGAKIKRAERELTAKQRQFFKAIEKYGGKKVKGIKKRIETYLK